MSALERSKIVPSSDFLKIGSVRAQEQSFKDFYVKLTPKENTMSSETEYEIDKNILIAKLQEYLNIFNDVKAVQARLPENLKHTIRITECPYADEIACLKLHTSPTVKIDAQRIKDLGLI